jgi:hypothetical protein
MSLKTVMEDIWYLDSRCSKNMTGKKKFLVNYECKRDGSITFDDGSKNKIVEIGVLNLEGIPKLKTLHVED